MEIKSAALVIEDAFAAFNTHAASHAIFASLQWARPDVRMAIAEMVAGQVEKFLIGPGQYRFEDHCTEFVSELEILLAARGTTSGILTARQVKSFVLACTIAIYQVRCPHEVSSASLTFDSFKERMGDDDLFFGMNNSEWNMAWRFGNYVLMALTLVSANRNRLMLSESSALLVGFSRCMQGSNPGKEVKRLQKIAAEFSDSPSSITGLNSASPTPLDLTGISLQDLISLWMRCNPNASPSFVASTLDKFRFSSDILPHGEAPLPNGQPMDCATECASGFVDGVSRSYESNDFDSADIESDGGIPIDISDVCALDDHLGYPQNVTPHTQQYEVFLTEQIQEILSGIAQDP